MNMRVVEVAGLAILGLSGVMLMWSLAFETSYETEEKAGPVRQFTEGRAGRAFEDSKTARLALARFPLPVNGATKTSKSVDLIKSLQIELARHGLDVGPADGEISPKTREAIAEYQRQMSLEETGQPSRMLLDHLSLTQPLRQASAAPESGEMIRLISSVQKQLADLGYSVSKPSGVVTGETRDAIARFERDTGLPVTGEVNFKLVQHLSRFEYTPL